MGVLKTLLRPVRSRSQKKFYKYITRQPTEAIYRKNRDIFETAKPYTMTSQERVMALIQAVRYLVENSIPGDFVECGVWKGGSMLAAGLTLGLLDHADRNLFLFDTFSGMTEPTDRDVDLSGEVASTLLKQASVDEQSSVWCIAVLSEVQKTMNKCSYPTDLIHYVVGDVLETLPGKAPEQIAMLRLDTDWYESTKHELEVLFPRLSPGGVLIIDDYGHWKGARLAVDEYIEQNQLEIQLHQIDYTGVIALKL